MAVELSRREAALVALRLRALFPGPSKIEMRALAVFPGQLTIQEGHHPRLGRAWTGRVRRDEPVDGGVQEGHFGGRQKEPGPAGGGFGSVRQAAPPGQGVGVGAADVAERPVVPGHHLTSRGGRAKRRAETEQAAPVDRRDAAHGVIPSALGVKPDGDIRGMAKGSRRPPAERPQSVPPTVIGAPSARPGGPPPRIAITSRQDKCPGPRCGS